MKQHTTRLVSMQYSPSLLSQYIGLWPIVIIQGLNFLFSGDAASYKFIERKYIYFMSTHQLCYIVLVTIWHPRIDIFWYIKIQPSTIDFSTRLWEINPTNAVIISQSLRLRSNVLGWIFINIHQNWSTCIWRGKCHFEFGRKHR